MTLRKPPATPMRAATLLLTAALCLGCRDNNQTGHPCGDGVCDQYESHESCPEDCRCGNVVLEPFENCDCGNDPGNLPTGCSDINGGPNANCSAACQCLNTCGDGVAEVCEECDCGNDSGSLPVGCDFENGHPSGNCSADCTQQTCGDVFDTCIPNDPDFCCDDDRPLCNLDAYCETSAFTAPLCMFACTTADDGGCRTADYAACLATAATDPFTGINTCSLVTGELIVDRLQTCSDLNPDFECSLISYQGGEVSWGTRIGVCADAQPDADLDFWQQCDPNGVCPPESICLEEGIFSANPSGVTRCIPFCDTQDPIPCNQLRPGIPAAAVCTSVSSMFDGPCTETRPSKLGFCALPP